MSYVYSFEAKIMKYGGGRYIIYSPKEYQEKLKRFHGKKAKVIIIEPEQASKVAKNYHSFQNT